MNRRERFLLACQRKSVDRPPIWVMRQAGRYLPEYRKLKETYRFQDLVQTPDLAVEVTLQPLKRYPLDAAITFSDILVIPEALGQPYHFADQGGISMDFVLETEEQIQQLEGEGISEKLSYVAEAQKLLRRELGDECALLGFCGSPWTLASYMTSAHGMGNSTRLIEMAESRPELFSKLMQLLSEACADYLNLQAQSGVDAVQLFDSAATTCPLNHYDQWSVRWMKEIREQLPAHLPVIVYARETGKRIDILKESAADIISVDEGSDLPQIYDEVGEQFGVQGNLRPEVMSEAPETVVKEAEQLLMQMGDKPGYLFNLGHGIKPDARPESMQALVETVTQWKHD
ncbi:MAG: uroporphyrinogen decarboxylase [Verrucomicrobiota bacterium]